MRVALSFWEAMRPSTQIIDQIDQNAYLQNHKGRAHIYSLHPQIFIVFDFYTNFDHSSYLK
jgi:hypothetical protein